MLRRLFFLFPDEKHAQLTVNQLIFQGISERNIHAIASGVELKTLPEATERQKRDTAFRVESFLWRFNLLVFSVALMALLFTLILSALFWSLSALSIMLATVFAGEHFVVHIPDVHLTEFTDALSHGEILLMVDVPAGRIVEIEDFVHRRHPEAVIGGVGWAIDAFGI